MNFRHLRTFVAIADHGGFARAASQLHLTQSAASRQIQALESELGVPLFDRIGRSVRLTSEGEDLLRQSRRVLAEISSLGERARALKTGETGVLRLGTTPQVIENLLADFLLAYRRRHPGVEVHLIEDGGARLPDRLENGDVHLTIMPAGDERFRARLLYPMHVIVVCPEESSAKPPSCHRTLGAGRRTAAPAGPRFRFLGVVPSGVPSCAYQAAHLARKRRAAHRCRTSPDGSRISAGPIPCPDTQRRCLQRAIGASWLVGRKMGRGCLGLPTLPGHIRGSICGGACRRCSKVLSRSRNDKVRSKAAAPEHAS